MVINKKYAKRNTYTIKTGTVQEILITPRKVKMIKKGTPVWILLEKGKWIKLVTKKDGLDGLIAKKENELKILKAKKKGLQIHEKIQTNA